jgi:hypothetical protein
VHAGGGEVTVKGATESVHRILDVTGFSRLPAVNVEACA